MSGSVMLPKVQHAIHPMMYTISELCLIDGKIKLCIILFRINLLFYLFSTVVPSNSFVLFSRRPFVDNTISTGLVGVGNVVLATKGLQERNTQLLDGTMVKNR